MSRAVDQEPPAGTSGRISCSSCSGIGTSRRSAVWPYGVAWFGLACTASNEKVVRVMPIGSNTRRCIWAT